MRPGTGRAINRTVDVGEQDGVVGHTIYRDPVGQLPCSTVESETGLQSGTVIGPRFHINLHRFRAGH